MQKNPEKQRNICREFQFHNFLLLRSFEFSKNKQKKQKAKTQTNELIWLLLINTASIVFRKLKPSQLYI